MATRTRRRWRRAARSCGVVAVLSRASDDPVRAVAGTPSASPTATLTAGWGGSEGHPGCVYDAQERTVTAAVTIDGHAPRRDTVTVTVTAFADENTSQPVGSSSRRVPVDGTVDIDLDVTFPVERAPLVDVDGVTACGVSVED